MDTHDDAESPPLTASGGRCAPIAPEYDFFGVARRTDAFPARMPPPADRGGIRYLMPWDYPDVGFGGYRPFPRWDEAQARAARRATEVRRRITAAWQALRGHVPVLHDSDAYWCGCAICDPDDDND